MGILDNKSRVMDAFLTTEGRRQLSTGDLQVKYVSFTDGAVVYSHDAVSGTFDVTHLPFLECSNLPQDQIVFEADDAGLLKPFRGNSELSIKAGQLLSYSFDAVTSSLFTGSVKGLTSLSSSAFASTAQGVLTGSIDNVKKLMVLGTRDELFDDEGFAVGPTDIEFVLTDDRPVDRTRYEKNVNHLESLFNDVRLSQAPNFRYLPPVNVSDETKKIGNYVPWGNVSLQRDPRLAVDTLTQELSVYESWGFKKDLRFDPTTRNHNVIGQAFEIGEGLMSKLDVIRFGKFDAWRDQPTRTVFLVGKIIVDDSDNQSFNHLFTLVFE